MGPLLAPVDKVVHNRATFRDTVSFIACPTAGGGASEQRRLPSPHGSAQRAFCLSESECAGCCAWTGPNRRPCFKPLGEILVCIRRAWISSGHSRPNMAPPDFGLRGVFLCRLCSADTTPARGSQARACRRYPIRVPEWAKGDQAKGIGVALGPIRRSPWVRIPARQPR